MQIGFSDVTSPLGSSMTLTMFYRLLVIISSGNVWIHTSTDVSSEFNQSQTRPIIDVTTSITSSSGFNDNNSSSSSNKTHSSNSTVPVAAGSGGGGSSSGGNVLSPYWQYNESLKWYKYGSPFLIIIGTVGNLLAIITLQSRLFKSSSTSFILSALALCDICVLDTGLLRLWILNLFNVDVRSLSKYGCKVLALLTYFSHQIASWTLILLTSERTISVTFPFKCKQLCNRKRIVIVWVIIAIILFCVNIHFFFSFDLFSMVQKSGNTSTTIYFCTVFDPWYPFFVGPWYWIDASLGDFIPFGVVFTGNVIIILKISRSQKKRSSQMNVVAKDDGKTTSTTITLIAVSFIFLLFSMPIDITFLGYGQGLFKTSNLEEYAIKNLAITITSMLMYANSAIEFILYFATGQKFRTAFLEMFCCQKSTKGGIASASKATKTQNEEMSMSEVI